VANTIIGNGAVQYRFGSYAVKGSNTYSGLTQILQNSLVETGNASAFGTGEVTIGGGSELLATANMTLANSLNLAIFTVDTATVAATHGHILALSGTDWQVGISAHVLIGDGTHDGTVLWKAGSNGTFGGTDAALEIR